MPLGVAPRLFPHQAAIRCWVRRPLVWSAAGVLLIGAAVAIRAATEAIPAPTTKVLLSATARVPGPSAQLAWPAQGEAALASGDGAGIGSSGPETPVPIASVAKVMTAYLVLSDHPLLTGAHGPILTITAAEAAHLAVRRAEHQSLLAVRAGETLTESQALQALLLPSADNMAAALARFDAGTRAAFVAKMNAEAASLGMSHTHFADPSGFDPATVSDATDLLLLGRAAMHVPAFASIVGERSATIPGVASFANYNSLVGTDGFTGIKTGSTGPAGQALLFSARREVSDRTVGVVGVVLEQHGPGIVTGALDAARTLADSFYSQLKSRMVVPAHTAAVAVSRAGRTAVWSTDDALRVVALPGSTVEIQVAGRLPQRPAKMEALGAFGSGTVGLSGQMPPAPGWIFRLEHLFG